MISCVFHDQLFEIMAEVDVDHDGKLDMKEFVQMMYNLMENNDTVENKDEMQMAFRYQLQFYALCLCAVYPWYKRPFIPRSYIYTTILS